LLREEDRAGSRARRTYSYCQCYKDYCRWKRKEEAGLHEEHRAGDGARRADDSTLDQRSCHSRTFQQTYGCDGMDRLQGVTETGSGAAWSQSFGYDPVGTDG